MTAKLFDTRTLDPGTRGRFGEDRWAPMRIKVHRWIGVHRGPSITGDELTQVLAKQLAAYGVTVHHAGDDFEFDDQGRVDLSGHYAVIECSLLAESHGHAAEQFAVLCDRALSELEDQWEWFEHNPVSKWQPRGTA